MRERMQMHPLPLIYRKKVETPLNARDRGGVESFPVTAM